jgi:hypothetical protein
MVLAVCPVCLGSTVHGCSKNSPERASTSRWQKTKLEQSTFLRYLWLSLSAAAIDIKYTDRAHTPQKCPIKLDPNYKHAPMGMIHPG